MPGDIDRLDQRLVIVGGMVDEVDVSLAVYGDALDPEMVTKLLGCKPTQFGTKGDPISGGRGVRKQGFWLLTLSAKAPVSPDEVLTQLFSRLPSDDEFWKSFSSEFEVVIRVGVHLREWNRGFSISKKNAARFAELHLSLDFDIYADPEDA